MNINGKSNGNGQMYARDEDGNLGLTLSGWQRWKGALEGAAGRAMVRVDGWVNSITGFGTDRDKSTYGYILPNRTLSDEELSALYHSDDMAARMVDVVPQEMMREGFGIELGKPEVNTATADKLASLNAREHLQDGIRWGRAFGGGAVLLGCDDGLDAIEPLDASRAEDIDWLHSFDRRLLWPASYYDEPGPKFGKAKTYLVTTIGGYAYSTAEVHESRLLIFGGAPTADRERIALAGWDLSVLQRAYEILRQFNSGWKAVETLMVDGNQAIFKMTGLSEAVRAGAKGQELLKERLKVIDLYRSVMRALVIDADGKESFERNSASFTDIPQTLDKFMLRLSSTVEVPVTILMGQSPAGMNATGESDFRWFYDRIRSKQNNELAPHIRRLVAVWLMTKRGRSVLGSHKPQAVTIKFPPLWTEAPLTQAQRRLAILQGDQIAIQEQMVTPEEASIQRFRPEGFNDDLVLSKEMKAAREALLKKDTDAMSAVTTAGEEGTLETGAGAPAEGTPVADEKPPFTLTASDLAAIVKVNEARASVKLPPLTGPDGDLTIPAFKAKYSQVIAAATNAEAGQPDGKPKPAPSFGGGPPGGGFPPKKQGEEGEEEEKEEPPKSKPAPDDEEELSSALEEDDKFDAKMRRFELHRDDDETGVSGTGVVAAGCVFEDGKVVMRWRTKTASTTSFDNLNDVLAVHGHGGKTRIVWIDEE